MKMKEMVMADSKYVKCEKKNYNVLCWLLKCTMIINFFVMFRCFLYKEKTEQYDLSCI